MAIQKTEKIWHNGKLIQWDDATLHVMSHVVHYGSSVFEGIRCYELPSGPAIFRAVEHMQRLVDSAKVYRMEIPFTRDDQNSGPIALPFAFPFYDGVFHSVRVCTNGWLSFTSPDSAYHYLPASVLEFFTKLPVASSVSALGDTKA